MNTDWDYAVAFTEEGRAELRQAEPDSRPLGPGEVAGETVVSLISTGTELAKYQGLLEGAEFPLYPGYAAVFEVTEVGSDVEGIAPGELVCCFGNHRSRQRAEVGQVSPVPRGLAPQEAAFARLMVVGLSALATTRARPPDLVAVLGLGPIGHLAAKVFDSCGYRLLVCDPDSSRREIAAQAELTAMARLPLDDPEVGGQVALVLECSGHEQAALNGSQGRRRQLKTLTLPNSEVTAWHYDNANQLTVEQRSSGCSSRRSSRARNSDRTLNGQLTFLASHATIGLGIPCIRGLARRGVDDGCNGHLGKFRDYTKLGPPRESSVGPRGCFSRAVGLTWQVAQSMGPAQEQFNRKYGVDWFVVFK